MNPLDPGPVSPNLIIGLPLVGAAIQEIKSAFSDEDDAEWIDERQRRRKDDEPTIGQFLLRWGHLSVTVTLLIFIWGQYEASQKARADLIDRISTLEKQVAINGERIYDLREANKIQDAAAIGIYTNTAQRIDQLREDFRDLQRSVADQRRR